MPFNADVYRVLVASPSDVGEERKIVPEVISEWNAISSSASKIILMPVKWETHTSPLLGGRPQSVINEQIVDESDLLVGMFWTRMGTSTGVDVSGTAEEIQRFVKSDKPVMLYFSQSPIDPDDIDLDQFSALKRFKERMRLRGLTESYSGLTDFRQKFTRQLAINLNNLTESLARDLQAQGHRKSKKLKDLQQFANESVLGVPEDAATEYLIAGIRATAREDGWADIASFGHYLHTYTPVNYKNFGYRKLRAYLESTGLFKFNQISTNKLEIALDY